MRHLLRYPLRHHLASFFALCVLSHLSALSSAATIKVNVSSATSVPGQCSLSDAVQAANTNLPVAGCAAGSPGADTIVFTPAVSIINYFNPVHSTTEALKVTEELTIDGSAGSFGTAGVRIQRDPTAIPPFRLLRAVDSVNPIAGPILTLIKLEFAYGVIDPNGPTQYNTGGGCINAIGKLNLIDVTVRECKILPYPAAIFLDTFGQGGGIYTYSDITALRLSLIQNHNQMSTGGGLYSRGSVDMVDSYVAGNKTEAQNGSGGGVYCYTTFAQAPSSCKFRGTTFELNTIASDYGVGAGLYIVASNYTLVGNLFESNKTTGTTADGAGAYISGSNFSNATMIINFNWFSNNQASGASAKGGGLVITSFGNASRVSVMGNTFSGNEASGNFGRGGGLFVQSLVTLANNTFTQNKVGSSFGSGGAVYLYGNGPVNNTTSIIANNTLSGNVSAAQLGGGIFVCDAQGIVGYNQADNCTNDAAQVLQFDSNIIKDNGDGLDIVSSIQTNTTGSNNIIGVTMRTAVSGAGSACNPGLSNMGFNGGLQVGHYRLVMPTMALPRTSCAVDAGNNVLNLTEDERGLGYPRVQGLAADVGAFETTPRPTITLKKVIIGTSTDAGVFNLSVSGATANLVGGTNPANNVGHNGSTGPITGDDGATVTLSETAGTGTNMGNYVSTFACDLGTPTMVNATTATLALPNFATAALRNVSCTFTNTAKYTLSTTKSGIGVGTVTSTIGSINCGATCSSIYAAGTTITLTAAPSAGSVFIGWSGGGCSGTATSCTISPMAAATVNAQFDVQTRPTLTLKKVINGTVVDGGVFNLSVSGGNPTGGSNPASNVGNNGSTGAISVNADTPITFSEAAGTGTVLANYVSAYACVDGNNASFVASQAGTSGTLSINNALTGNARNITCTFTNTAKPQLTVNKNGSGTGTVSSAPAGVNCGSTCASTYAVDSMVTLTAAASAGSQFVGWSGGVCAGNATTCVLTLNASKSVTAQFDLIPPPPSLTVNKSGAGSGSVSSSPAGITCGASCAVNYATTTLVTLSATPAAGSQFAGWSGPCTGMGSCVLNVSTATFVTAVFEPIPVLYSFTVNKSGNGQGTVVSDQGNINCGNTCSANIAAGSLVQFTAIPAAGAYFLGWSGGCCSGTTPSCVVTVNNAQAVSAQFATIVTLPVPTLNALAVLALLFGFIAHVALFVRAKS